MPPVSLALVGAGARGAIYASYALEHPDRASIVAVAEPRAAWRESLARDHRLKPDQVYTDWREIAGRPRLADAVVIATQDRLHADPAVAFADLGYAIMLEKPMAPTLAECERIVDAVRRNGNITAVCHFMRYVHFTKRIRQIIDDGLVGDVITVEHHHPVGWWHYAHGWVRGNWSVEALSSPMLVAKACHDIDWLQYILGADCVAVSSFGSLTHFRAERKPAGAGDRCVSCDVEPDCPYSAVRIYGKWAEQGETGWPLDVLTPNPNPSSIREALETGPYGRCVYGLENDVIDHQVVSMLYDGGQTATLTMSAFNKDGGMMSRIYGTRGEIWINGGFGELRDGDWIMHEAVLRRFDFVTEQWYVETPFDLVDTKLTGHSNGDYHLVDHFVSAVANNDRSFILTDFEETLKSHRTVFAAEESRRTGQTVQIAQIA